MQWKSSLRLRQHTSVNGIRIVNVSMSWFSLCDKTVQIKQNKTQKIQRMLEILVPPGRIPLVGLGLFTV